MQQITFGFAIFANNTFELELIMKNLFLIFFSLFAFFQSNTFSQNIDINILKSINATGSPTSDKVFKFLSNSEAEMLVAIPVGLAITSYVRKDTEMFKNSCLTAVSGVLNVGVTLAIKYAVDRKRPYETYSFINKKVNEGTPSFPSSHTSSAFNIATSLCLVYPKWYVIVPSYLWAGSVAYSRMYLGAHYPSDVLGGIIVGAGSAYISYKTAQWFNKKYYKHHGWQ